MSNTTKTSGNPMIQKMSAKPLIRVKSEVLLNGQQSLYIEHEGEVYVLRITRQGKLILTK